MKQGSILVALALLLAAAQPANAAHKLLVTDLLDTGQAELKTGYQFSFLRPTIKNVGSYSKADDTQVSSLGFGLGHGLQLDLSLRQVFKERSLTPDGVERRSGMGDLSAGLQYRYPLPEQAPLAVVAGFAVAFDSAPRDGAGERSTVFSPSLSASYRLGSGTIPYFDYHARLRTKGEADSHEVVLGVEKELNHVLTLDGKLSAEFATSADLRTPAEDYAAELGAYLQLRKNLYLLPSGAFLQQSRRSIGEFRQQSVAGFRGGLALYYYFD
ncbi:hypothetical protein GMLC_36430 [Geomonas limicola]|uniref:Transporter n=1 Tax=Geomonas limicola TaxID=2740186 RepID=A0A6V8NE17_9BACT|nr:hypothetical protein [Geomonas limicola]GFO70064.1 hypothetical protein GMLC_36430 [Geomonas limicola]